MHWKGWCWSWNSSTLATWFEELTHWRPWCWDWRQIDKRMTEDEMAGWHHWQVGHEFEQAQGAGEEQGSLACCSPWGRKESDTTEQLNWTESYNWNLYFSATFIQFLLPSSIDVDLIVLSGVRKSYFLIKHYEWFQCRQTTLQKLSFGGMFPEVPSYISSKMFWI